MEKIKIPKATAKRLPLYYRYLIILNEEGKDKVSSTELSEAVQVDSASIRRDFSYFGALGKRGYGYDVKNLLSFFKKILNQDTLTNVALIGVGNLGRALLNYNFKRSNNIRISCAFDINKEITGRILSGVPVYDMDDLKQQLSDQQITIAVLVLQEAKKLGIKVPKELKVIGFDGTKQIQTYHSELSTIAQPIHDIATLLVKLLLTRISNPDEKLRQKNYILPVKLIKSETTA